MDVIVNESLVLGVDSVISVCATDANIIIPYVEESGKLLEFAVKFKDEALSQASVEGLTPDGGAMVVPMIEGVEPNRYKATLSFGELACGGEDIDVLIDVYYPDSVIAQRWNDVLAVRNDGYNGGYEFVGYQWYKNNQPIEGATSSILYEDLDFDAEYSVLLTREDGVKEMVCAITPIYFSNIREESIVVFTTSVASEVQVAASASAMVRMWSSVGLLVGEYRVEEGDNVLNVAGLEGVYIAEILFDNGMRQTERIVIR